MFAFGYAGETSLLEAWFGFFFGMCGWGNILFEIFKGKADCVSRECSAAVKDAFNYMRVIVTVGWAIYPLGYFNSYLLSSEDKASSSSGGAFGRPFQGTGGSHRISW